MNDTTGKLDAHAEHASEFLRGLRNDAVLKAELQMVDDQRATEGKPPLTNEEILNVIRHHAGAVHRDAPDAKGTNRGVLTMRGGDNPGTKPEIRVHFPTISMQRAIVTNVTGKTFPMLTKALTLPMYANAGDYRSYRIQESAMVMNVLEIAARVVQFGYDEAEKSVAHIVFAATLALKRERFPMYFVGRDLVQALQRTDLPKDLRLDDVRWPHGAVTFVMPTRAIVSPNESELFTLSITRITAGEELAFNDSEISATLPSIRTKRNGNVVLWATLVDHHNASTEHKASCQAVDCHPGAEPSLANYAANIPYDRVLEFAGDESSLPNIGDLVAEPFLSSLPRLAINLLLALAERPELIEAGGPPKRITQKATNTKVMLWQPRYLGRSYKLRRERNAQGGSHQSPRVHWRRGHWRDARVGPSVLKRDGQRLGIPASERATRRVWIEPILVNAINEGGGKS